MNDLSVLILAAGLGKRMKHELPKVMTASLNGPMILSVLETARTLNPEKIVVITGHKRELVEELVRTSYGDSRISFAYQAEQKGTGHAVQCSLPELKGVSGNILILYGDTPLISSKTLQELLAGHKKASATLSILTLLSDGQTAYGRIIRNDAGEITLIREAKDCSSAELAVKEVNSGIYIVNKDFLFDAVSKLENNNAQKEFYLTDIIETAHTQGKILHASVITDMQQVQGVNDFYDLALVNRAIMETRIKELLQAGVQILDPNSVFIEKGVSIGAGTRIGPNVQLKGNTTIGARCVIEGSALIDSCTISDDVHIKFSVRMEKAVVQSHAMVGPFAHIRPDTILEEEVKVGNFVEVKKSTLKKGAKASHLTYLGDATVGEDANVGAGTITCNYDGKNKYQTTIESGVFIGSNSSLVAPVIIHKGATIGAGSVITKDVEAGALALTRAELRVKKDWKTKSKKG